jgi:beta-glucosidase
MTKHLLTCVFIYGLMCWIPLNAFADSKQEIDTVDPKIQVRVNGLLEKMTVAEKVALLSGADFWNTVAIERLAIPSIQVTDGPNGVRSNNSDPTTLFPVGVAMASTWNPTLIQNAAAAMGRETRAMGAHVLLGPNVNIQRVPLAGRNFEAYSEDPYLSAEIGLGFVLGVQSENIGTSLKHFVANNQEHMRRTGSSNMDQRTLREIYMPAFEKIVKQAKPWTVMAAYNKVNGVFMTENKTLLQDVLKEEWGFNGVVVSDWGALHTTALALDAGLDLEMPGPAKHYGAELLAAIEQGDVDVNSLNNSVKRLLTLVIKTGAMDTGTSVTQASVNSEVNSLAHQRLSQQVAEEAITLLKNEKNLLPLNLKNITSMAVIGPNADAAIIQGGGSSQVVPFQQTTPLEGLQALLGETVKITYAQGVDNEPEPATLDARLLSPDKQRTQQGLRLEYFGNQDFSGTPVFVSTDSHFSKLGFADEIPAAAKNRFSARWQGYFWPKVSGRYEFELVHLSSATLTIDGQEIINDSLDKEHTGFLEFLNIGARKAGIELTAGVAYPFKLDYVAGKTPVPLNLLRLASRSPSGEFSEAVKLAKESDVAVVFIGVSTTSESEGRDRADLALFGKQNALLEAVLKVNKNTIVVLNNGAPLAMPWIDQASTVIEAWLPGQEGGHAIANVLFGHTNPSGKLPVSFPKRLQDNPSYLNYPGDQDANYGEGIFVGYRYYDKKDITPLFPFGHGLSYTHFNYSDLTLSNAVFDTEALQVSINIKNTGAMAGKEVVQLYIQDNESKVVRPIKELKGFNKVSLRPGELKKITFTLTKRDLSYFDVHSQAWRADAGKFTVLVGSSSRDIRQKVSFQLPENYSIGIN